MTSSAAIADAATDETTAAALQGHIDAVEGDRVYGWAWNASAPGERLIARLLDKDGGELVTGLADQPREDLQASSIGDGAHSFVLVFKGAQALFADNACRVEVHRLQNSDDRMQLALVKPAASVAAPAAPAANTPKVIDAEVVNEIRARDKRLWGGLKQLAAATSKSNMPPKELVQALAENNLRMQQVLEELTAQNSGVDVVHMRLEKMISDVSTRLDALDNNRTLLTRTTGLLTWAILASVGVLVLAALLFIMV